MELIFYWEKQTDKIYGRPQEVLERKSKAGVGIRGVWTWEVDI